MTAGRGVSTVLDVALCLLLVSASALTLAGVQPTGNDERDGRARDVANVVATSTARIDYSLVPADAESNVTASDRTARGTLAELLAAAAIATASVDGERLDGATTGYEQAVRTAVRRATRRCDCRVQVRARWRPYPDAHLGGRVTVGATPPPDVDVDAATLTVPSGMASVRHRALEAARADGFVGVARVVAGGIVRGFARPSATRLALAGPPSVAPVAADRYRRIASRYGVETGPNRLDVAEVEERLTAAVARAVERDLRARFDSPTAAARTVSAGRVRITVRTWST